MFTFLGSFKVYPMKWDCRVIKFSFTWRKYTMSIKFHCVFPWLTRNTWSEMISLTGDCELASSLPDSEEGGKWMSRILPREQRWLDVRGWFFGGLKSGTTDVFLIYDTQCLALKWNCPEEIWKLEFLFLFWIKNVCSIIYFILTGDRV